MRSSQLYVPAAPVLRKERLERSAIPLFLPEMERGTMGDDSLAQCRRARALVSCCPTKDDLQLILVIQLTLDLLSHQDPVWVWRRSTICSRIM